MPIERSIPCDYMISHAKHSSHLPMERRMNCYFMKSYAEQSSRAKA